MSMVFFVPVGIASSGLLCSNSCSIQGMQLRRCPVIGSRLIDEAGGRRFIKGLTGRCKETWRCVSEGLMSCCEDVESAEDRLVEDVGSFEQRISATNEDVAAKRCEGVGEGRTHGI